MRGGVFSIRPLPASEAERELKAAADSDAVSIFTAVDEQLGLRLQTARAPLDVVVVERIERPTPD